jgi:hypothetical protein
MRCGRVDWVAGAAPINASFISKYGKDARESTLESV